MSPVKSQWANNDLLLIVFVQGTVSSTPILQPEPLDEHNKTPSEQTSSTTTGVAIFLYRLQVQSE